MTQIASSHNQPAFKDIWGHLRSFVVGYYSIVSCTQIRVSHFKIITPNPRFHLQGEKHWKVDFSEMWIISRKWIILENMVIFSRQKIFVQFRFPIIRISTFWNSGIISASARPITVPRCAWPITNYFRSTCLSQGTLPTAFQFDSLQKFHEKHNDTCNES